MRGAHKTALIYYVFIKLFIGFFVLMFKKSVKLDPVDESWRRISSRATFEPKRKYKLFVVVVDPFYVLI